MQATTTSNDSRDQLNSGTKPILMRKSVKTLDMCKGSTKWTVLYSNDGKCTLNSDSLCPGRIHPRPMYNHPEISAINGIL